MVPYLGVHIRYQWGTQWSTVCKAVWPLIYPNRAINSKCMWVAIRLKQKETTPDIDVKIQKLRLKIEMAGAVISAVFTFGIAGWLRGFLGRNSSAVSVSAHCICKYISISKSSYFINIHYYMFATECRGYRPFNKFLKLYYKEFLCIAITRTVGYLASWRTRNLLSWPLFLWLSQVIWDPVDKSY